MFTQKGAKPVKAWVDGVEMDPNARDQLFNAAQLPIIHKWVAAMPDVHYGIGATVGSVIPTKSAIIPAAVGVDIGCGMCAVKTSMKASDLPDDLSYIRSQIEKFVPHGRSNRGGKGDLGAWENPPRLPEEAWKKLRAGYDRLTRDYPSLKRNNHPVNQLGTLGSGNHFIEVCLDENQAVWFMLHSGSRGVGNRIGQMFISLAQKDMRLHIQNLPDKNLAYFEEGAEHFEDYVEAVHWAQDYARINRKCMLEAVIEGVRKSEQVPQFTLEKKAVNCHHNYVAKETHYGEEVFVTRKGAVNAEKGRLGIIPGSMGAKSFIVCGKGHPESFCSCSHGAGRVMSRSQAKKRFSVKDHEEATQGVECRKDAGVIDETPGAYKDIDAVMLAQSDLVDIVHTLKQVVCVKG
ncbi:MAG: RtcB family protein [Planctomycetota bacterium]|jgi:tRNA-splicing ligase RtcB